MNSHIRLKSAGTAAVRKLEKTDESLSELRATFVRLLNGNTGGALAGTILGLAGVAILYAAAVLFIFIQTPVWAGAVAAVSAGLLLISRIADVVFKNNYYKVIRSRMGEIDRMRHNLTQYRTGNSDFTTSCLSAKSRSWDLALTPGESVVDRTTAISMEVKGLNGMVNTGISRWKDVAYYIAIVFFGATGCYSLFGVLGELITALAGTDINEGLLTVLMAIITVIAVGAGVFFGSIVRTLTNGEVNNVTMLVPLASPIAFGIVSLLITLLVLLVILVVKIILYILAVAVGVMIIVGMCSGG